MAARSYRPLGDLARLAMERHGLDDNVRALARLLDLEGDEQHRVYGWLRPGARGSYSATIALLEELGMLTPEALAFLKGADSQALPEEEATLAEARRSVAAGRAALAGDRAPSTPRPRRRGAA